ncbi:MAG: hypothetical protein AAF684_06510, partial [Pseudomonadota bacterium]
AGGRITYGVRADLSPEQNFRDAVNLLKQEAARMRRDYPGVEVTVTEDGRISFRGRMDAETQSALRRRLQSATRQAEQLQRRRLDAANDTAEREQRALEREIERAVAAARARAETAASAAIVGQNYTRLNDSVVIPDYQRIAEAGADQLADALPAFRQLVQGLDQRAAINRLLAFFQSIPYDPLTSRSSGGDGSGFALPVALLARNRGDCDTKSIAFASVLHRLSPQTPIGLVLLDDHALIALGVPARPGDRTFTADGRQWVLAEPVGPRLARLGEIGEQTRSQLRNAPKLLRLF